MNDRVERVHRNTFPHSDQDTPLQTANNANTAPLPGDSALLAKSLCYIGANGVPEQKRTRHVRVKSGIRLKRKEESVNNNVYDRVSNSPLFAELVKKRNRFAYSLSALMLIIYYSFVLFASTNPDGFATPISDGSKVVIGMLAAWGIQALAFILTGIYVHRANSDFDGMIDTVVEESVR
jgi:uncharacterized membrane protein (DUF485 family)